MKPLKIAIVDDGQGAYERLEEKLLKTDGALSDLNINYIKGHNIKEDLEGEKLLKNNPDMIILTYNPSKSGGLKFAEKIREKRHTFVPIMLTSDGSDPSDTLIQIINDHPEAAITGLIDRRWEHLKTQQIIRNKLKRKLNVSILGLGCLGIDFIEKFLPLKEIGSIKGFSERKKPPGQGIVDYGAIYNYFPSINIGKLNLVNSLEEAIDGTDCAIISTSAIYGPSTEKIAEKYHRLDLINLEGKKVLNYSKRIKEANYPGLVVCMTNPVGGNLILAKQQAGLVPGQLTSSIDVDDARFLAAIKERLGPEYDNFIRFAYQAIGDHGDIIITKLNHKEVTNIQGVRAAVRAALIESRKSAERQMEATEVLRRSYSTTAEEAKNLFLELAHFSKSPEKSYYCFRSFGDMEGAVALPVKINYFPYIRFNPDEIRIRQLGSEALEDMASKAVLQNLYIQKFLNGGSEKYGRKD